MIVTCSKIEEGAPPTWKVSLNDHAPGYGRTVAEAVGDFVLKNIDQFKLAINFPESNPKVIIKTDDK